MPPKPKFTREQVIEAALGIVSQKGMDALTANSLRSALRCSVSPLFTLFDCMQEIEDEVHLAAMRHFEEFRVETPQDMPAFKQIGMKMVLFGCREPKLYQLLFMQEHGENTTFADMFGKLGAEAAHCIETVKEEYALSDEKARAVFENVWIYTYGVGALCATGMCHFTEEELGTRLTTAFQAILRQAQE